MNFLKNIRNTFQKFEVNDLKTQRIIINKINIFTFLVCAFHKKPIVLFGFDLYSLSVLTPLLLYL